MFPFTITIKEKLQRSLDIHERERVLNKLSNYAERKRCGILSISDTELKFTTPFFIWNHELFASADKIKIRIENDKLLVKVWVLPFFIFMLFVMVILVLFGKSALFSIGIFYSIFLIFVWVVTLLRFKNYARRISIGINNMIDESENTSYD